MNLKLVLHQVHFKGGMMLSEFVHPWVIKVSIDVLVLSIDSLIVIGVLYVLFNVICKAYARFKELKDNNKGDKENKKEGEKKKQVEDKSLNNSKLPPPKFEVVENGRRYRITEYDNKGIRHSRIYSRDGLNLVCRFRENKDEDDYRVVPAN